MEVSSSLLKNKKKKFSRHYCLCTDSNCSTSPAEKLGPLFRSLITHQTLTILMSLTCGLPTSTGCFIALQILLRLPPIAIKDFAFAQLLPFFMFLLKIYDGSLEREATTTSVVSSTSHTGVKFSWKEFYGDLKYTRG